MMTAHGQEYAFNAFEQFNVNQTRLPLLGIATVQTRVLFHLVLAFSSERCLRDRRAKRVAFARFGLLV